MRNRTTRLVIVLAGALVFSLPAAAQGVYYPGSNAQEKAAEGAKAPPYNPRDLSGIWRGGASGVPQDKSDPRIGDARPARLMGGAPPPPMTPWAQGIFDSRKPSAAESWQSRRVAPALGNDPLGNCDPLGYPRNLGGTFEFVQTATQILQIFDQGRTIRQIWTDGRKIPDDVDPRWYGWATGRWEGDALIVDSFGYDDRTWLDGNGWPHSDEMKLREVYRHPNATTLEVTMTLDDAKAYTKTWAGNKQTFKMVLPKEQTVMYEYYCVPSEEESFNRGVRNPAGGDLENSRPLQ